MLYVFKRGAGASPVIVSSKDIGVIYNVTYYLNKDKSGLSLSYSAVISFYVQGGEKTYVAFNHIDIAYREAMGHPVLCRVVNDPSETGEAFKAYRELGALNVSEIMDIAIKIKLGMPVNNVPGIESHNEGL